MPRPTLSMVLLFALLAACGGAGAGAPPSAPGEAAAEPPAASEAVPAAAEPASPRKRRPFEIHSMCSDVVTVVFGEDPKAADAGSRTLAPNSSIEGARDAEGRQTVWLLDADGEPLIKVDVTRGMKRVEIGRSCRTLDAR